MSDNDTTEGFGAELMPDELTMLKQRADMMGITYSPRIGVDALRDKIQRKLDGQEEPAATEEPSMGAQQAERPLTKEELEAKLRKEIHDEEMKLVRVRISCLNPDKKDLRGEILTVANKYLGIVKKYIPYDGTSEEGYHVPHCLLTQLRERRFNSIKTYRSKQTGRLVIDQKEVPEFAIEILPQLTEDELKQLAAAQAAAGGV